ncbi:hypothetical protein ACFE04_011437 [Oxalis oulophora]
MLLLRSLLCAFRTGESDKVALPSEKTKKGRTTPFFIDWLHVPLLPTLSSTNKIRVVTPYRHSFKGGCLHTGMGKRHQPQKVIESGKLRVFAIPRHNISFFKIALTGKGRFHSSSLLRQLALRHPFCEVACLVNGALYSKIAVRDDIYKDGKRYRTRRAGSEAPYEKLLSDRRKYSTSE